MTNNTVSAIILAAGESKRMGQPKTLLPWRDTSVIGQVLTVFSGAGIDPLVVVTGSESSFVGQAVGELAIHANIRLVYNPLYTDGSMLHSLQQGLRAMDDETAAVLVGLGDQPQVLETTIRSITAAHQKTGALLVVPSHQQKRGHPWLVARPLWQELLALPATATARQFLSAHAREIVYVEADASVLLDLDTPEEYEKQRP